MGFQRKTYRLVWPDESRWSGLEVRMKPLTFDGLQDIARLRSNTDIDGVSAMLDVIEQGMISWNLTDEDDAPIPITNIRKEDATMLMAIVNAWTEVVGDIPAPLPSDSPNGKPLEEVLIPMEIPSSSHPNSNTPS